LASASPESDLRTGADRVKLAVVSFRLWTAEGGLVTTSSISVSSVAVVVVGIMAGGGVVGGGGGCDSSRCSLLSRIDDVGADVDVDDAELVSFC